MHWSHGLPGGWMRYALLGLFWTAVYLALVLAPLVVLNIGPMPAGRGFWWDLSAALGFAGTAMMGVMFILTARFHHATAPFGIDIIYYFHRQIALVVLGIVLAHPIILLAEEPGLTLLLTPPQLSFHMSAGILSLSALLALVVTSLARKKLHIHYDGWRLWHASLAVAALGLALVHIDGVGYYSAAPWKRVLWMVIVAFWFALLAYVRLVRPYMLLRRPYQVEEVVEERGDTWSLVLRPDGHGGMSFQPGQFAWLTIWHSPFALKEHPFSISSSALRPERLRFSIKELGDFTRRIKHVVPGERVYVDGPYGAFSVDRHRGPGYVFIAGGIGIAPVMGMLRTLADREDRRPLLLYYAYKSWERLTFREELESLRARLELKIFYVLNEPHGGWTGEVGFLSEEILGRHLPGDFKRLDYFVCGPVPVLKLVESALHKLGVPISKIHSELFDLV